MKYCPHCGECLEPEEDHPGDLPWVKLKRHLEAPRKPTDELNT